ncbi:hypothetical protein QVD17_17480 [Tagetes erecta]|uniref:Uncharacterized protein n=1 Tax=Tagetes erecta TaxID=13708 RepID=A0AAD8P1J8_TARER|nr:hypothetical protein QVD17_17480 [Tagetes erecta]
MIPSEIQWYYLSCKKCNKKLTLQDDETTVNSPNSLIKKPLIYICKNNGCPPTSVAGSQRQQLILIIDIDDEVTPLAQAEKAYGKRQIGEEATFKRKSKNPDFKRKLVDDYEKENEDLSTIKSVILGKKTLLIPKIEK